MRVGRGRESVNVLGMEGLDVGRGFLCEDRGIVFGAMVCFCGGRIERKVRASALRMRRSSWTEEGTASF
jgi:hypothetical protein